MTQRRGSRFAFQGFLFFSLILYGLLTSQSIASPILEVKVGDVTCWRGQQNVEIPIYIKNPIDSIAGFDMWLMLDRPDFAAFRVDSGIVSGCLLSVWGDFVRQSVTGTEYDLKISALKGMNDPFILPQDGTIPLLKILVNAANIADSVTERTANIYLDDQPEHFSFSDLKGDVIGMRTAKRPDTSWFICISRYGEICLQWQKVLGPPADSIAIDTLTYPYYDTTLVNLENGSIAIRPCGDANSDNRVDVQDITYLIGYLYRSGKAPAPLESGDMNKNQLVNVLDITTLINSLYRTGVPPNCD